MSELATDVWRHGPEGDVPSDRAESGAPDPDWNPELAATLYELLPGWMDLPADRLQAEIATLEPRFGESIYAETIFILAHLRLPPPEAKHCWQEILALREEMRRKLDSFVDLRIALASYFVQVNRKLRNPKIIELQLFERTRAFAYRDDLTGLYNHRFLEETLAQETLRAERSSLPASLVLLDVDDFKRINDRFGHEAGNEAVVVVAELLRSALRGGDVAARYGGEEFAAILPATHKTEAFILADRLRARIESHRFVPRGATEELRLTVSVGIATSPGDAKDPSELIRCADRALYVAKGEGKNQVQLYGSSRRSFPRVHASLDGTFRVVGDESVPLRTLDVGDGGVLFASDLLLAPGRLVEFRLALREGCGDIHGVGRVVYSTARGAGTFETAVRLVVIAPADREVLSRFVAEERRRDEAEATPGA